MKKNLLIGLAALAAVIITSCQKDQVINQVPQEQAIDFSTYTGRNAQTKATIMDLAGVQSKGFGVFGYYLASNDYNETTSPVNLMYNQAVTFSTDIWTYEPEKYWSSTTSDKYAFIAYAPYSYGSGYNNISDISANTKNGDPTFTFTVNDVVAQQTDLLYAKMVGTKTQITADSKVALTFSHALSRIGFKATPRNETDIISINSVKLTGKFIKSASFNIYSGTFTGENESEEVTYTPGLSNNSEIINTEAEITTDGNYIMIIPKAFTGDANKITITVDYSIKVQDAKLDGAYTAAIPKVETTSINYTFVAGKAYTFIMTVSPSDPIQFNVVAVDEWIRDTDSDEIPDTGIDQNVNVPGGIPVP